MKHPKIKATAFANGLNQNQFRGEEDSRGKDTTPIKLNEVQIAMIVACLSLTANQERRFIEYLGRNPLAKTKDCCRARACANLSHLTRVTANTLATFGLEAKCIHLNKPIKMGMGKLLGKPCGLCTIWEVMHEHKANVKSVGHRLFRFKRKDGALGSGR